jgi:hypothetical protein
MPASDQLHARDVFINCPFDAGYKGIFDALIFTVIALGYTPRCARETDDAGEIRLHKIERIIEECPYGIHDISSVALDPTTQLPRFNMPFELGLFLGCKRYSARRRSKKECVILDHEEFRYQKFLSDIAGQDIRSHGSDVTRAIVQIRDWLTTVTRAKGVVGGKEIAARYQSFLRDLPVLCSKTKREPDGLTFNDLKEMIESWLEPDL